LYITTAREGLPQETLDFEVDAGRLFCVDVGISGLPIDACRIDGPPM
jgi:sugar lactone lactonase YvrE